MAILDTGSSITIINRLFLQTISYQSFKPLRRSFSSANCTHIEIIGEVLLAIKLNNISTYITAFVASQLVTNLLLGADWIDRYIISIHLPNKTLLVQDASGRSTTVPIVRPTDPSCSSVTLVHATTVPSYSESVVDINVPVSECLDMLFEPSSTFDRKAISLSPALLRVSRNRSQLIVRNPTHRTYTLSKNTRLGVASPHPLICGTSLSSTPQSPPPTSSALHRCYVCSHDFLSSNDLHRHLTDSSTRTQIQTVLWKHAKLFDTTAPSKINFTLENAIDTGDHRPVYTAPYRRSPADYQAIDAETTMLSRHDCIEPSTSTWCSPVVLVRKKDGTTRFCVDYRKLNEVTVKDSFPLPRLDDIFDQISGSNYFTKLDFKSGYFQVPLAPRDRPKTAFSTRDNHYQFKVLP